MCDSLQGKLTMEEVLRTSILTNLSASFADVSARLLAEPAVDLVTATAQLQERERALAQAAGPETDNHALLANAFAAGLAKGKGKGKGKKGKGKNNPKKPVIKQQAAASSSAASSSGIRRCFACGSDQHMIAACPLAQRGDKKK